MTDVYKECPSFENEKYLIRFVDANDADDLMEVYADKNALPFFNSDNCDGDNFYYPTKEKMQSAIDFWLRSYDTKWFVRFTRIDKASSKAIGTTELFHRKANDSFNGVGVLRLDVKSGYEKDCHLPFCVRHPLECGQWLQERQAGLRGRCGTRD